MSELDVVITMGGLGSRFRNVGYTIPKYMIEAKGKTLFDWSLDSLSGFSEKVSQYIFVAMKDESVDVASFVSERCAKLGIVDYKLILLDYLTDGQATTAMMASKYWHPENGLLIYNIDTYVEPGAMTWRQLKGDGFIPCFRAPGDHWSFVRTDGSDRAIEIREKQRISENCTLGAYYFRSCQMYAEMYGACYSDPRNLVRGEKYVAPIYDYMIRADRPVYMGLVEASCVHVLGTPEEVAEFVAA